MIGVRGGRSRATARSNRAQNASHCSWPNVVAMRLKRVELAEQQAREPVLLPLAQELLDEANARVLLLAGAAFLLERRSLGGPTEHPANDWSGDLSRIEQLPL